MAEEAAKLKAALQSGDSLFHEVTEDCEGELLSAVILEAIQSSEHNKLYQKLTVVCLLARIGVLVGRRLLRRVRRHARMRFIFVNATKIENGQGKLHCNY